MAAAIIVVIVVYFGIRLPEIEKRPVHTDEAVNGYTIGKLLEGAPFRYDPKDYHGPSFIALGMLVARAAGARDLAGMDARILRWSAVASGLLALAFVPLLARVLGPTAAFGFALILCADPLSVYFGRYAIHETLFVSANLGFLACGLLAAQTPAAGSALAAGGCAGLMLATKETAVIPFAAAAAAALVCLPVRRLVNRWIAGAFFGAAAFVIVLAFTWGLQSAGGLVDLALAYPGYFVRAGGAGHEKPFYYYANVLFAGKSGLLLFALAVAAGVRAWRGGGSASARFLSVYAVLVAAAYSLIPYKTPWLAMGIWLPCALLAAIAVADWWRFQPAGAILCGVVLLGYLAADTVKLVFKDPIGERNPYAYSHTLRDTERLPQAISRLSASLGRSPRVAVVADDAWPLPWYLRSQPMVGYWRPGDPVPESDFVILDVAEARRLEPRMAGWRPRIFGQRPEVVLILYTAPNLEPDP